MVEMNDKLPFGLMFSENHPFSSPTIIVATISVSAIRVNA
jgi:hypothetical protein